MGNSADEEQGEGEEGEDEDSYDKSFIDDEHFEDHGKIEEEKADLPKVRPCEITHMPCRVVYKHQWFTHISLR